MSNFYIPLFHRRFIFPAKCRVWEVKNMKKMAMIAISILMTVALLSCIVNAGPIVSVSTDKEIYAQGESVLITITNNCRGQIVLDGYTIEDETGREIYSAQMVNGQLILQPGERFTDVWMQVDDSGNQVAPGAYIIDVVGETAKITIKESGQASIEISTDRTDYLLGEEVVITITNTGNNNVIVPNGYWVEDTKGTIVYTPNMVAYMRPLAPGESISYSWDQIGDDGYQVEVGAYVICTDKASVDINIIESVPIEVTVDKTVYEQGETVVITMTNAGNKQAVIPGAYWIEDSIGNIIFTPNMPAYMIPLAPGASIEFTWDMTDDMGNQVVPGTYSVCTNQNKITIDITAPENGSNNDGHTLSSHTNPGTGVLQMPSHSFTPKPSGLRVRN